MNNLSWLLYLSDVLPGLSSFISFVAGFIGCIALVVMCAVMAVQCQSNPDSSEYRESGFFKFTYWLAPLLWVLCFSMWLVPSKETFYLIAASEMGEEVLTTPEVGKIRTIINQYLDEAIDETAPEAVNEEE